MLADELRDLRLDGHGPTRDAIGQFVVDGHVRAEDVVLRLQAVDLVVEAAVQLRLGEAGTDKKLE